MNNRTWFGGYFIIVGIKGSKAVKRNTRSWIIATMVLSIVSALIFCTGYIIFNCPPVVYNFIISSMLIVIIVVEFVL